MYVPLLHNSYKHTRFTSHMCCSRFHTQVSVLSFFPFIDVYRVYVLNYYYYYSLKAKTSRINYNRYPTSNLFFCIVEFSLVINDSPVQFLEIFPLFTFFYPPLKCSMSDYEMTFTFFIFFLSVAKACTSHSSVEKAFGLCFTLLNKTLSLLSFFLS